MCILYIHMCVKHFGMANIKKIILYIINYMYILWLCSGTCHESVRRVES